MTRIALVGAAEIGASYATARARLPQIEFAAVVEGDPGSARRLADLLGVPVATTSFESLLDDGSASFDAVLIHGSGEARLATAERAATAGKHVLVASPLAESVAAARHLIDVCRSAGVTLMVGQVSRFLPSRRAVKAAVDTGKLGEPGLLRIHAWTATAEQDAKTIAVQHAVDGIDLAHWLFAGRPERVYALGRPGYVQVHLGFPHGGMALIDYATNLPEGDAYSSLSLIGSTGAAYADDHPNRQLLFRGGPAQAINGGEGPLHLIAQLADFVSAIEAKREPTITGDAGMAAVQVAAAAVASLEFRRVLRFSGGSYELA
jgi:myo-inositol 2-dehydrogenase/D-chiro-inositol 1-dehydrogenase